MLSLRILLIIQKTCSTRRTDERDYEDVPTTYDVWKIIST